MRKIKTTPEGQEPNRFSDMGGYVIKPDEPPTWVDAMSNLWAAYFEGLTDETPDADNIKVELARLRKLDEDGKWNREYRREIAG